MYQNYIFDLYGTLLDIRTDEQSPATWRAFAAWMTDRGLPASPGVLHRMYNRRVRRLEQAESTFACPEIDLLPVFGELCRHLQPDAADDVIWQAGEAFRRCSTRMLAPYAETFEVLHALRRAGKGVYLLTNAQRVFTWRELTETGLLPCFDDVLISSDAGCKKPDPAFFRLLMDKHRLDPRTCVMVGNDSTSDIAGAAAVGMDAVYLRTAISPTDDPTPSCRFVFEDGDVRHVLELLAVC